MVSYDVKVRNEPTYLYGGALVTVPLTVPVLLMCRVDEFGEDIEIKTHTGMNQTILGRLSPGQTLIISIMNIDAVAAHTTEGNVDSDVRCTVLIMPA